MRVLGLTVAAALLASAVATGQRPPATTFDEDKPGAAPAGFVFAPWRQPTPGQWAVRRQEANGYLWHGADAAATGYSLAIAPAPAMRDLVLSVRLRLAGGSRAGGLAWRYQDDQNYYAAVLDLAAQQLFVCRVTGGNRVFLEYERHLELDVAAWHVLKVVHDDHEVRVSLGGIRVFEESDRNGSRGLPSGKSGVIAQGNAEVWFDDLRIDAEDRGK